MPMLTDAGETPVTWSPSPASHPRWAGWDQGVAPSRPGSSTAEGLLPLPMSVSLPEESPAHQSLPQGRDLSSILGSRDFPSPWNCKAQPCRPVVVGFSSLGVWDVKDEMPHPPTPVRVECPSHRYDSEPHGRHLQPPWVMLWGHVKLNICSQAGVVQQPQNGLFKFLRGNSELRKGVTLENCVPEVFDCCGVALVNPAGQE